MYTSTRAPPRQPFIIARVHTIKNPGSRRLVSFPGFLISALYRLSLRHSQLDVQESEGGWCGWKPSSNSSCSIRLVRAYYLIESRQAVLYRAIRGSSISVNSTLPTSYQRLSAGPGDAGVAPRPGGIQYCTVLQYTIPYHTILYYTILRYSIQYYIIMWYRAGRARPRGRCRRSRRSRGQPQRHTPSPPTKSFPIESPWVKLSGRLPIKFYGRENSAP